MTNDLMQLPAVLIGEIVSVNETGAPCVRWNEGAPVVALGAWIPGSPRWLDCIGARAILGFIDGDEQQPIVLGLLDAPRAANGPPETLRLESTRELHLQCGDAKVSLRHDGRVEIRGTHVISRSSGVNKVKGGSVFIN